MTFPRGVCVCVRIQVQLWHTWLKRLLSQASCFTITSTSVLPHAAPLSPVAAVKQPFWEQQTHEEVLVCQTSVLSITVRLQPCRVQKTQRSIHKSLASGGNRFSTHLLPRSLANTLPSSHIPPYLSLKGRSHMQGSAAAKQPRAIDF